MTVYDLDRDQLEQLKQNYLMFHDGEEHSVSYDELANANELVPDSVIFEEYSAYDFSPEDFGSVDGCNVGEIDEHAVREIELWFRNNRELYEKYTLPLSNSLVKKMRKGIIPDVNYLANSSIIADAVRETIRSYERTNSAFPVSSETRAAMKYQLAKYIIDYAQDDYDYENSKNIDGVHKYVIAKVIDVSYRNTSIYGNPSYYVQLETENGEILNCYTTPNASLGYSINNPDYKYDWHMYEYSDGAKGRALHYVRKIS